jgi:hypothetical protein
LIGQMFAASSSAIRGGGSHRPPRAAAISVAVLSSMNVTFQVYTHHSTGHDKQAAEQISRLIQEAGIVIPERDLTWPCCVDAK